MLFLLLCFGISTLMYFFFNAAQMHFKIEAGESMLLKSNLEIIKLPLNEFRNNKTDDEVWANGRLYDISSYTVENDTVYISVFHDKDEETLVKGMAASFDQNDQNTSDNLSHLGKHSLPNPNDGKILFIPFSLNNVIAGKCHHLLPFYTEDIISVSSSVIKPPPDKALS